MGQLEDACEVLFGAALDPDSVTDCRVVRAKLKAGGLAGAAAAVAVGLEPTWITVVLNDGRTFKAQARGAGREKDAIEVLSAGLNAVRADAAREALREDRPTAFGQAVLLSAGLRYGKKTWAWTDFVGFRVGEGYLQLDTARGLTLSVLLSAVPFGEAFATLIAEHLPGRNYDELPHARRPRFGFLAASAATHLGGTMTARGRVALLGGVVLLLALGGGGYWGWMRHQREVVRPAEYALQADRWTDAGRKFARDDAAFFAQGLKVCPKPDQSWSWAGPELVALGAGPKSYWILREGSWRQVTKLENPPDDLYAWAVGPRDGQTLLRVVKQTYKGPECRLARALGPDEVGRAEETAKQLIAGAVPSLDLDAPPPPPPPAPVVAPPVQPPPAASTTRSKTTTKKTTKVTRTTHTKKRQRPR